MTEDYLAEKRWDDLPTCDGTQPEGQCRPAGPKKFFAEQSENEKAEDDVYAFLTMTNGDVVTVDLY